VIIAANSDLVTNVITSGEPYNNLSSVPYNPSSTDITNLDSGPAESASDIYARILLAKRIGYPLWFPEPSNYPPKYQQKGVCVGDLGYITFDGHFDFLFNICLPSNHPINYQAPPGFHPLEFNGENDVITTSTIYTPGNVIASESIQMESFGSDAEFQPNR
jgi:hypothetical protein